MKIKTWKRKGKTIDHDSPGIVAELRREDEVFGRFVGVKAVRIAYVASKGALRISGILVGRVVRDEAGRWAFLPSYRGQDGWYLTLGVREGCPAMIVVREIDEIDRKHVRAHWSPQAVAEYTTGLKTAGEIEEDHARRKAKPNAKLTGARERHFFGMRKRLGMQKKETEK